MVAVARVSRGCSSSCTKCVMCSVWRMMFDGDKATSSPLPWPCLVRIHVARNRQWFNRTISLELRSTQWTRSGSVQPLAKFMSQVRRVRCWIFFSARTCNVVTSSSNRFLLFLRAHPNFLQITRLNRRDSGLTFNRFASFPMFIRIDKYANVATCINRANEDVRQSPKTTSVRFAISKISWFTIRVPPKITPNIFRRSRLIFMALHGRRSDRIWPRVVDDTVSELNKSFRCTN